MKCRDTELSRLGSTPIIIFKDQVPYDIPNLLNYVFRDLTLTVFYS